jgi:hypothetical protein
MPMEYAVGVNTKQGYTLANWLFTPDNGHFDTDGQLYRKNGGVVSSVVLGHPLPTFRLQASTTIFGGSGVVRGGTRAVVDADQPVVLGYDIGPGVTLAVDHRWSEVTDSTEINDYVGDNVSAGRNRDYAASGTVAFAALPCAGGGAGTGSAILSSGAQQRKLTCLGASVATLVAAFGTQPVWHLRGTWVGAGALPIRLLTTAVD